MRNAEGVCEFKPRATPWEKANLIFCELCKSSQSSSAESLGLASNRLLCELFQSLRRAINLFSPGRCPGLEFANAFGVVGVTLCNALETPGLNPPGRDCSECLSF